MSPLHLSRHFNQRTMSTLEKHAQAIVVSTICVCVCHEAKEMRLQQLVYSFFSTSLAPLPRLPCHSQSGLMQCSVFPITSEGSMHTYVANAASPRPFGKKKKKMEKKKKKESGLMIAICLPSMQPV